MRKGGSFLVKCVGELLLTPVPEPLPQNTKVEKGCLLLLVCLLGCCCLALEELFGDRCGEWCCSDCLEGMRAAVKAYAHLLKSYYVYEEGRSPSKRSLMNKSLLLLCRGSVNGGRIGFQFSCIPFQKVNIGM